jgi:hypothetical protein
MNSQLDGLSLESLPREAMANSGVQFGFFWGICA